MVRSPDRKAPTHPHHEWGQQRPQIRKNQLGGDKLSQRNLLAEQPAIEVPLERIEDGDHRRDCEDDYREARAALPTHRGLASAREAKDRVLAGLGQAVRQ